jgi:hypothetical protein
VKRVFYFKIKNTWVNTEKSISLKDTEGKQIMTAYHDPTTYYQEPCTSQSKPEEFLIPGEKPETCRGSTLWQVSQPESDRATIESGPPISMSYSHARPLCSSSGKTFKSERNQLALSIKPNLSQSTWSSLSPPLELLVI